MDAAANTLPIEVRKIAYRQSSKDGFVVTFAIHPNETHDLLASAPLGTRYVMALVELNDDETPKEVVPNKPATISGPNATGPSPSPEAAGAIKERTPFNELPATTQAVLCCKDAPFQRYVVEEKQFLEVPDDQEKNAACYVRRTCDVNTRGALSTSKQAGRLWHDIYTEFLSWRWREQVVG